MNKDRICLLLSAFVKVVLGIVLIGALLFLPAGTLAFVGAWRLFAILFTPMVFIAISLATRSIVQKYAGGCCRLSGKKRVCLTIFVRQTLVFCEMKTTTFRRRPSLQRRRCLGRYMILP